MSKKHWSEKSAKDFRFAVAFDYIAQVQIALEERDLSQSEFAERVGVSKGRISQLFNNPGNMTMDSMVRFARGIGQKMGIVFYDDGDPQNELGPVDSELFRASWEAMGKPRSFDKFETEDQVCFKLAETNDEMVSGTNIVNLQEWKTCRGCDTSSDEDLEAGLTYSSTGGM